MGTEVSTRSAPPSSQNSLWADLSVYLRVDVNTEYPRAHFTGPEVKE